MAGVVAIFLSVMKLGVVSYLQDVLKGFVRLFTGNITNVVNNSLAA